MYILKKIKKQDISSFMEQLKVFVKQEMENNNTSEVVKESNEEENTISSFRQQVNQERLEAYSEQKEQKERKAM